MLGSIKTLVSEKGFGFITPEDGGKDVFFHSTELLGVQFDSLKVGDAVSFEITDSPKGPKASGVSRA